MGGVYRNKLRSWETLSDYRSSGFGGLVALRAREGGGGQFCVYDLAPHHVQPAVDDLVSRGVSSDSIMVNEMVPSESTLIQGEYWNAPYQGRDGYPVHCYLLYSRVKHSMRRALALAPETAEGLRADLLLKDAMTPGSYEDWQELLQKFPDHALEVSVYDICVGDVPGRNALVWEVRRY